MIAELAFGAPTSHGGKRIRETRFAPRSGVAISTACVVANGMRETLRSLFGGAVSLELGDVATIDAEAWRALARDAELLVVRGTAADAALVLDPIDARRLLLRAFGEDAPGASPTAPPSSLERHAYDRIVAALALALDPLCGERRGPPQRAHPGDSPWTSYFDIRIRAPIDARIGVVVAREKIASPVIATRSLDALASVAVDVDARVSLESMSLARFSTLAIGEIVRFDTKAGHSASLNVGEHAIAHGTWGIASGHLAVQIDTTAPGDAL